LSDIGTSTLYSTEWVVDRLRAIDPSSILDVGCGWGRWGFLAREFLELWKHRYTPSEWVVRIDALDIHPGTWTGVHAYIYDHRYEADVRTFEPVRHYDAVIACDVLEHMEKDEGLEVLGKLRTWGGRVIVGVPIGDAWPLRAGFDGNPYEAHLSRWYESDFPGAVTGRATLTEDGLPYGLYLL